MNKVQILGTITRDIELKHTQGGVAIANFGIAYNESYKQADGSKKEVAHFFDCTAFGRTAEIVNEFFHRGSRILIDGSLDYQSWVANDGSKKSKVGIKVLGFDFIDRKVQGQEAVAAPVVQAAPKAYSVVVEEDNSDEIPF
jgi:single-strand DNA-binding protein